MKRDDEVDRLTALAFKRLKRAAEKPQRLPDPEQTIVLVASAQGVIENGGFQYFFEMDWPDRPDYAVFSRAYRTIGARKAADRIDRAVAMFPFGRPHQRLKQRNAFMASLPESSAFFRLGAAVCVDESVWTKLHEYVLRHEAELRVPIARRRPTGARERGRGGDPER